jgi:hypothetical protein
VVDLVEVDLLARFLAVSELAEELRVWLDPLVPDQFVHVTLRGFVP